MTDAPSPQLAFYRRNRDQILSRNRERYAENIEENRRVAREKAKEAYLKESPPVEKQCLLCDKPFLTRLKGQRKYCSDKCTERARNILGYGLSVEDYRTLIGDGRCFICRRKIKKWHIDHNHKTLETRGVLCQRCNVWVVAGVEGNVETALRLVEYLEHPPARGLNGDPKMVRETFHRERPLGTGGWQQQRAA